MIQIREPLRGTADGKVTARAEEEEEGGGDARSLENLLNCVYPYIYIEEMGDIPLVRGVTTHQIYILFNIYNLSPITASQQTLKSDPKRGCFILTPTYKYICVPK